nr:hypothetical protein [Aggregatilinea lenta]
MNEMVSTSGFAVEPERKTHQGTRSGCQLILFRKEFPCFDAVLVQQAITELPCLAPWHGGGQEEPKMSTSARLLQVRRDLLGCQLNCHLAELIPLLVGIRIIADPARLAFRV